MMTVSTIERARGRWPEILRHFGIEERFLRNKHGPCPNCGGKDRFRFDNKNGEGTFYCGQCGPGTGLILLRRLRGWDHKTACDEVDKIIGREPPPVKQSKAERSGNNKLAAIERLLEGESDEDVVSDYLRLRGLSVTSPVLFGRRWVTYYRGKEQVGRFPAIIAPIVNPAGDLVSAQRIWRKSDVGDEDKKMMPAIAEGATVGAAVRLFEPDEQLGIAEGVCTALAAHELYGIPVWAVISAGNMEAFNPPSGVYRLHIFGDNDESFTGQAAATTLARRLSNGPNKIECSVNIPPDEGSDWLDVLNHSKTKVA